MLWAKLWLALVELVNWSLLRPEVFVVMTSLGLFKNQYKMLWTTADTKVVSGFTHDPPSSHPCPIYSWYLKVLNLLLKGQFGPISKFCNPTLGVSESPPWLWLVLISIFKLWPRAEALWFGLRLFPFLSLVETPSGLMHPHVSTRLFHSPERWDDL